VAKVGRRLAEAEAALATFDIAVEVAARSEMERDSAILRMIYTFEAVWKACQQLLAEREKIEIASPGAAIRAARQTGWLSDDDAERATKIANDRNLAVHMYRGQLGSEIERRLAEHSVVLHRWLGAMQRRAATDD
jgi:uncharacterized protein YutE (UPF0331/DUF86 family)